MPSVAAALLWLLLSCASTPASEDTAPPPRWMLAVGEVYPQDKFMAAVGEGASLSEAQQIATGNLAAGFKASVRGRTEAVLNYSSSGRGNQETTSSSSSSQQAVETAVDQTLQGITFSDPYQQRDARTFVVAYLDRDKVGQLYRQQIEAESARVSQLLEQAALGTTGKLFGCALVHQAYQKAKQNQLALDQLAVINPTQRRFAEPKYSLAQLQQLRLDYMRNLPFGVDLANEEQLLNGIERVVIQSLQDLGLPYSKDGNAVIKVRGTLQLNPVALANGYQNVFWQVEMEVVDDQGKVVVSYSDEGRESGRTLEQAKISLLRYLKQRVNSQVADKILAYFNGFEL